MIWFKVIRKKVILTKVFRKFFYDFQNSLGNKMRLKKIKSEH